MVFQKLPYISISMIIIFFLKKHFKSWFYFKDHMEKFATIKYRYYYFGHDWQVCKLFSLKKEKEKKKKPH